MAARILREDLLISAILCGFHPELRCRNTGPRGSGAGKDLVQIKKYRERSPSPQRKKSKKSLDRSKRSIIFSSANQSSIIPVNSFVTRFSNIPNLPVLCLLSWSFSIRSSVSFLCFTPKFSDVEIMLGFCLSCLQVLGLG